ncbi:unnamed protein product [Camellia sinensis]
MTHHMLVLLASPLLGKISGMKGMGKSNGVGNWNAITTLMLCLVEGFEEGFGKRNGKALYVAGEVVEVGSGFENFKDGDKVVTMLIHA